MNTSTRKLGSLVPFILIGCIQSTSFNLAAQIAWKPTKQVTIVVPYSPGGGIDATARAAAKQLSVIWGHPVVVENLPGADGAIGGRRVMESRQDGHTLLIQVPALLLSKYTPGFAGPDPLSRLEPVTVISKASNAVVISGKLQSKSLPEFIHYCKTSLNPCSFATGDTTGKFFMKKFVVEADIPNAIIVNYKGGGALVADLLSNNVNVAFTGLYPTLPHHKIGTMRILVTTGVKRAASTPDVSTAIEAGLPDFVSENWVALFAPKGTPSNIINGVADAVREAVTDPETIKVLVSLSAEPIVLTPAAFQLQLQEEVQRTAIMARKYPLD